MKGRIVRSVGTAIGVMLFLLALRVLYTALHPYSLHEIARELHGIPRGALALATLLTAASYLLMTLYDFLALRYIRHPLEARKIATASFVGYAFSNNVGLSMVAGASVRYRLYTSWGLSALEITRVILFNTVTLWLGFFAVGGILFLMEPLELPATTHLPFATTTIPGVLFLIPVFVYGAIVLAGGLRKEPAPNATGEGNSLQRSRFKIGELEFTPPPPGLSVFQMTLAMLDWALAGTVLYVLLPGDLSYPLFLSIFLLAQFAGLLSQVPGGLGIFEATILTLLTSISSAASSAMQAGSPSVDIASTFAMGHSPLTPTSILGALVVYRLIYYILPFLVAMGILGAEELLQRKRLLKMGAKAIVGGIQFMAPPILAVASFLGGIVLLFSGATPGIESRLTLLSQAIPLPVVELSHFLGSVAGVALLLLANSLRRRIDAAFFLSVLLLGAGIFFSLLKGLDYEEAMVLTAILSILLLSHRGFYRKGSLFDTPFTAKWILLISIAIISTFSLTYFSYKHVEYSPDLWWSFALEKDAPRSLRALVGALTTFFAFSLANLLHPAKPRPAHSNPEDWESARAIVSQSGEIRTFLALLGDKTFLFNDKRNAFIMYGISGKSWIAMGDPVGPREEWPELLWRFQEMCDRYDGWPVFYEISSAHLDLYIDLGMTLVKLGEEALVDLERLTLEGGEGKEFRHTLRRLEREECTFEIVPAGEVSPILPELKRISDEWLAEKNTREKGFSLGIFREDYIRSFPVAIVRRSGKIIAFAVVWETPGREEVSVDLMRFASDAPGGVMDFLFLKLMLHSREKGYRRFNLGMAPLSGLPEGGSTPLWNRIGNFLFRYAEHFYNFQGLRQFKEKYRPQWKPRYLASPTSFALPVVLASVTALLSGGVKGILTK